MINILSELFADKRNPRVIDLCSECLVEITKFIKDEDKGFHILTIVIVMAHDDSDEEARVLATRLFNSLATIIGRELCELYVVPQIASFADDPHSKVRKAVAGNFLNMCISVSENSFKTKLLPVYQKLSKDSLWMVRKAAAEILPKITELCDSHTISTTLLDIFKSFTGDNQKYVRIAAIEVLGQFINLLKKEDLNDSILDFYIKIVDEYYTNKDVNESDIIYHCAYNFPAVLFIYGKEKWPELRNLYKKMATDREYRVKRSIASSIGEIANIIGPQLTESDIIPILEKLYLEEGDIQILILKNIPMLLKNVPDEKRINYLDKLQRVTNPREKWRTRSDYSRIVSNYSSVFDEETTYNQILPIAMQFCLDDVAQVRFKASKYISRIILHLLSKGSHVETTLKLIEAFAFSINYHYRQLFVRMCTNIFEDREICEKYIINYLIKLCNDKVVNVRISLSKVLSKIFKKNELNWVWQNEDLVKIAYKLKLDANKNVNILWTDIAVPQADPILESFNHLFTNNMNILIDEFGIYKNLPLNSRSKYAVNDTNLNTSTNENMTLLNSDSS
jgi:serine/threonine-protein phosphatase 4 regulatory subunit 1